MNRTIIVLFLLVDLLVVCGVAAWFLFVRGGDTPVEPSQAVQPVAISRPLVDRFEAAHRTGRINELSMLVYWEAVDQWTRESVLESLAADLDARLIGVKIHPTTDASHFEYHIAGIKYTPNLPVQGQLIVTVIPDHSDQPTTSTYIVGSHNGVQYIATAAPDE